MSAFSIVVNTVDEATGAPISTYRLMPKCRCCCSEKTILHSLPSNMAMQHVTYFTSCFFYWSLMSTYTVYPFHVEHVRLQPPVALESENLGKISKPFGSMDFLPLISLLGSSLAQEGPLGCSQGRLEDLAASSEKAEGRCLDSTVGTLGKGPWL